MDPRVRAPDQDLRPDGVVRDENPVGSLRRERQYRGDVRHGRSGL